MKRYLIITTSGREYIILADDAFMARKIALNLCKRTGDTFERCRQIR